MWIIHLRSTACRRPDRSTGTCLSVYDCPSVIGAVQRGVSAAEAAALRSLSCNGDSGRFPWVCCELRRNNDDTLFPEDEDMNTPMPPTKAPTRKPVTVPAGGVGTRAGGGKLPGLGECGIDSLNQKIYGGTAAGINEFPWMALLEYKSGSGSCKWKYNFAFYNAYHNLQILVTKDALVVLVPWSIRDIF